MSVVRHLIALTALIRRAGVTRPVSLWTVRSPAGIGEGPLVPVILM
jgi:hypothetical protein